VCHRWRGGFGSGCGWLVWSGTEVEEEPDGQGEEDTGGGDPDERPSRAFGLFGLQGGKLGGSGLPWARFFFAWNGWLGWLWGRCGLAERGNRAGGRSLMWGCWDDVLGWDLGWDAVQGAPGFKDEAEEGVGVVFVRLSRELGAGGGDCQCAQQVSVADVAMGAVDDDPEMGGEVTMKGAVALEAMDDGRERLPGCRDSTSLEEKVAQLCDLIGIASRHLLEL
jgi:hypothetical protein